MRALHLRNERLPHAVVLFDLDGAYSFSPLLAKSFKSAPPTFWACLHVPLPQGFLSIFVTDRVPHKCPRTSQEKEIAESYSDHRRISHGDPPIFGNDLFPLTRLTDNRFPKATNTFRSFCRNLCHLQRIIVREMQSLLR